MMFLLDIGTEIIACILGCLVNPSNDECTIFQVMDCRLSCHLFNDILNDVFKIEPYALYRHVQLDPCPWWRNYELIKQGAELKKIDPHVILEITNRMLDECEKNKIIRRGVIGFLCGEHVQEATLLLRLVEHCPWVTVLFNDIKSDIWGHEYYQSTSLPNQWLVDFMVSYFGPLPPKIILEVDFQLVAISEVHIPLKCPMYQSLADRCQLPRKLVTMAPSFYHALSSLIDLLDSRIPYPIAKVILKSPHNVVIDCKEFQCFKGRSRSRFIGLVTK